MYTNRNLCIPTYISYSSTVFLRSVWENWTKDRKAFDMKFLSLKMQEWRSWRNTLNVVTLIPCFMYLMIHDRNISEAFSIFTFNSFSGFGVKNSTQRVRKADSALGSKNPTLVSKSEDLLTWSKSPTHILESDFGSWFFVIFTWALYESLLGNWTLSCCTYVDIALTRFYCIYR